MHVISACTMYIYLINVLYQIHSYLYLHIIIQISCKFYHSNHKLILGLMLEKKIQYIIASILYIIKYISYIYYRYTTGILQVKR